MFDEPVFAVYCYTTAKFEEKKNILFKYVWYAEEIIQVEHIWEKYFI